MTLLASMEEMAGAVTDFRGNYSLFIPRQGDKWRDYKRSEESLLQWHAGFQRLQARIASGTGIFEALKGDDMVLSPGESVLEGVSDAGGVPEEPPKDSEPTHDGSGRGKQRKERRDTRPPHKAAKGGKFDKFHSELESRRRRWRGESDDPQTTAAAPSTQQPPHPQATLDESAEDGGTFPAPPQTVSTGWFGLSVRVHAVDELWLSGFLTVYVLLLAAAYVTQNGPVAALAFVLNCMFLLLLYRAKLLNDAVTGAVEGLRLAQVRLAGVFASYSSTEMVAQALCLRKIDIIAGFWEAHMFGVRLPLLGLGAVAVDTNLLLSVTLPNLLGLLQLLLTLVYGEPGAAPPSSAAPMRCGKSLVGKLVAMAGLLASGLAADGSSGEGGAQSPAPAMSGSGTGGSPGPTPPPSPKAAAPTPPPLAAPAADHVSPVTTVPQANTPPAGLSQRKAGGAHPADDDVYGGFTAGLAF